MAAEIQIPRQTVEPDASDFVKKRAPTLLFILTFKLAKGSFFLVLAIVFYCLSDNNLNFEYQRLLHFLHANPEGHFWVSIAAKVNRITESNVLWTALATLIYSSLALSEGIGLLFRISWAGWLAICESIFFIPLETYDLMKGFSWGIFGLLVLNIVIVWYLIQNRHRLFRHLHH